jgi:small-conductance mechanosensitive channel
MIETIRQWIELNLSSPLTLPGRLVVSLLILLLLLLIRPFVTAIVSRRTDESAAIYRWSKASEYAALLLGIILLGVVWLERAQSVFTYLGLLSAGLAIALQDPISNLVGWLFIIGRRPFEAGDRIEIGGHAGDVIDIGYFQFSLMEIRGWVAADQSTGRVLHVPNKAVFSQASANFSKGFDYIWEEIPVEITFESDWRRAKEIIHEIGLRHVGDVAEIAREQVRDAARRYMINYDKLMPIVYTKVNPSGVLLTLRFLSAVRGRRGMAAKIWEDILDAFALEPDIEFAYPTRRIYYQSPAAGPETPDAR